MAEPAIRNVKTVSHMGEGLWVPSQARGQNNTDIKHHLKILYPLETQIVVDKKIVYFTVLGVFLQWFLVFYQSQ